MGRSNYAGEVFGKKVTFQEFNAALIATRNQMLMQFGDEFLKQADQINLEPQAWERIILLIEAKRRKIKLGDEEVISFIRRYPLFLRNEKFDYPTYEYFIKSYFFAQPRVFEEQIRENLKVARLYEAITQDVKLTEDQIRDAYIKENEQISVFFLSAPVKDFQDQVSLDEALLRDYFTQNQEVFKRPASFNLEYLNIEYTPEQKTADIKYREEKVKQIYRKLKKKNDLVKLAKELALELKESGFFNLDQPIPGIGWSIEIIALLDRLKIGQLSGLIKTENGWYILRLKEKKEAHVPPFEEIENEIKAKFLKIKSKELARHSLKQALSKLKEIPQPQEADFENIAKEFNGSTSLTIDPERSRRVNLKSGSTELFRRASYIPGIGSSDAFFLALSKVGDGRVSEIIEMEQDFFVIKLKQRVEIEEEKYLKEKEEFTKKLNFKEKEKRFIEFFLDLKRKAGLKIF
jgi:peptidyl-prolyl cis-trans isomerase D